MLLKPHLKKILFLLISFLLVRCSSEVEDNKTDTNQDGSADEAFDTLTLKEETAKFFYSLPSPVAIAVIFRSSGLKYVEGITNNPTNVSKYSTIQKKALNLGVYNADLSYTVLNKQNQHAVDFLDAVSTLSGGLGMGSIFQSENYFERFKQNIGNEDSLSNLISDLKMEADAFMYDNDKQNTALFIFTGVWVESIYISTQLTKNKYDERIALLVVEQKYNLDKMMHLLTDYEKDPEFEKLYLYLNSLKAVFDRVVTKGDNEEPKIIVTERDFYDITEKVQLIRSKIINN